MIQLQTRIDLNTKAQYSTAGFELLNTSQILERSYYGVLLSLKKKTVFQHCSLGF